MRSEDEIRETVHRIAEGLNEHVAVRRRELFELHGPLLTPVANALITGVLANDRESVYHAIYEIYALGYSGGYTEGFASRPEPRE